MKKYAFLICLMTLFVGCTDDIENDVDSLMKVQPKGLTLLENEILVQNSDNFEIPFRVNPSHYPIENKDISLDVFRSEFSRTFPISSVSEYQLDSVVQVKDETGNLKEGEWKACIHIKDGRYYSYANLALVLNYKDAQEKDCMLTSSSFVQLTTVPVMKEDMVDINNYISMSAFTYKGDFNSHQFTCTPAPISEGSKVMFDMEGTQIDSFRVEGPNAGLLSLSQIDKWKFQVEPSIFFNIPNNARYIDADLVYYFRDIYNDDPNTCTIRKSKNIRFYKTKVTPELLIIHPSDIVPKDTIEHISAHVDVPLADVLAQCGITDEALEGHPHMVSSTCKIVDKEGEYISIPVRPSLKSENDSQNPSQFYIRISPYGKLQDKYYGMDFYVHFTFHFINPQNGEEQFYCDLNYPMRFEKE